ncbi:MAG: hypothetical protein PUE01_12790 [Clostridiaceae bacterium]|nr:hypothetical protein [Clostridiaceae bacterium]
MKKFINIMTLASSVVTSILIICTLLTSYQFHYVQKIFYSYRPIQIGLSVTMGLLAIRFWINEHGNRKIIYSLLSLTITALLIVSINYVK